MTLRELRASARSEAYLEGMKTPGGCIPSYDDTLSEAYLEGMKTSDWDVAYSHLPTRPKPTSKE